MQSQALASAAVGAINVFGTVVAGSLVDRAGRKQLLLVSFLGMAASMLAMSAGLALPQLAVRGLIIESFSLRLLSCLLTVATGAITLAPMAGKLLGPEHLRNVQLVLGRRQSVGTLHCSARWRTC